MTHIWPLPLVEFRAFDEIEENRPVVLVSSPGGTETVEMDLRGLKISHRIEVDAAAIQHWMEKTAGLLAEMRRLENPVLYAVGGGLAADAAKYFSQHTGMPLVCLPTGLPGDAIFTGTSGVRHSGCIDQIETRPPDRVVIDFDVLAAAPKQLRAAGICDVLSIATGLWDWEYAEEMDMNPEGMELIPWAGDIALSLLQAGLDCAEAAGAGDPAGLKQLLDCLAVEVQLCNQLGHSRPKEGSEHYFAYAVEDLVPNGLPPSVLLGPGILVMAEKQGQETDELQMALKACHVPLDAIRPSVIQQTLDLLPGYVREHDLPFGIAHEIGEE